MYCFQNCDKTKTFWSIEYDKLSALTEKIRKIKQLNKTLKKASIQSLGFYHVLKNKVDFYGANMATKVSFKKIRFFLCVLNIRI